MYERKGADLRHIYGKIITTIALGATSNLSHDYHFFFVVGTFKIYSRSSIQIYNTALLATVTTLNIRPPEFVNPITGSLYSLTSNSPFPPPPQLLATSTLLSVSLSLGFLHSTCK